MSGVRKAGSTPNGDTHALRIPADARVSRTMELAHAAGTHPARNLIWSDPTVGLERRIAVIPMAT